MSGKTNILVDQIEVLDDYNIIVHIKNDSNIDAVGDGTWNLSLIHI